MHDWSSNMLQVAALIRLKSVNCSDFLRDYLIKLPSKSTIRRSLCKEQIGEGFIEINLKLAERILGPGPAALMFDEISLREQLKMRIEAFYFELLI